MATEFELKYLATPEAVKQIDSAYPGGTIIPMTTVYYDTRDRALADRKWTLRHRQEGQTHVCTLKTPGADGMSCGEWECECDDILLALPTLAEASGLQELTDLTRSGLTVTCGAQFQRTAIHVTLGSTTAEIALDQGVLINGSRTAPLCECEVELKSGSPEDVVSFAQKLSETYRLPRETRSKFARANALGQEVAHGS